MKHLKAISILGFVILLLGICSILLNIHQKNDHPGLVLEKGYVYISSADNTPISCSPQASNTPQCGFCDGKVIDKQCYVKPSSPFAQTRQPQINNCGCPEGNTCADISACEGQSTQAKP